MNELEQKLYNNGERLVPYISHNDDELVRHRSSYIFFHNIIDFDQQNDKNDEISIVDLGFGSGWGSAILAGIKNTKILSVDIGQECKTYAEKNYSRENIRYLIEDAREFVSQMDASDYVVSRGVLEHIPSGLDLIRNFKFKKRIIVDVPYNEPKKNSHHLILNITEKDFKNLKNCEIFYEDINGAIYKDYCPKNVNMIMVVISDPKLEKVGSIFQFPIMPIRNEENLDYKKNDNIHWLEKKNLRSEVIKKIKPVLIGLDIGAGINPHDYLKSMIHVCCEPYEEYVNILAEKISNEKEIIYIIRKQDWRQCIYDMKDKSIDSVYLIDVIEHLSKEESAELLKKTERITRRQIIIFTPLGFMKQEVSSGGKDAWGLNGAKYQEHKSGWSPEDFDKTWEIYACKEYHLVNNIGEKLEKPFGAFWAIKNFNDGFEFLPTSADALPIDIKDALINKLPYQYFKIFNKFMEEKSRCKQLQSAHKQLQLDHHHLVNSKAVRYGSIVKKFLRKIGISYK